MSRTLSFHGAVLCALVISSPALAQSADLAPITNLSDFILDFLTGPFARSIAGIAVVALGIMAKAGRLKWQYAGSVIFGIALVFGGATIADQLANAAG
ncbi:MAG: TrbC/VirB2 family protein [Micavibrio sp.]|nr:TrbC/VirB2 family protein [Micavibrio sp.]